MPAQVYTDGVIKRDIASPAARLEAGKETNMKTIIITVSAAVLLGASLPAACGAAVPASQQRTFSGTVTRLSGNQVTFKTASAASYTAETSQAVLVRKNGTAMRFEELLVGDRIEVRGTLWPDNSMNALYVRNMSLYTHTGTFTGKIASIDPANNTFTMQSRTYGTQTVRTDGFTTYKKNSKSVTFKELETGYSVTVKGVWDRANTNVLAKSVQATVRLVNITVTGVVSLKNGTDLTVLGSNNVIYGVDAGKARFTDRSGKAVSPGQVGPGDKVTVRGKHVSESVAIVAESVKDASLPR